MKVINPKPISEIRAEKDQLAQKDALIAKLKEENETLRSDGLMTMEAVAELYEELLVLKGQMNGGTNA